MAPGWHTASVPRGKLTPDLLPLVPRLSPPAFPSRHPLSPRLPIPSAPRVPQLGMSPSPPAPEGGDTAVAQPGCHLPPHRHGRPAAALPPRLPAGASERGQGTGDTGTRHTRTCQHAPGPPVTPHGRGRVSARGCRVR